MHVWGKKIIKNIYPSSDTKLKFFYKFFFSDPRLLCCVMQNMDILKREKSLFPSAIWQQNRDYFSFEWLQSFCPHLSI